MRGKYRDVILPMTVLRRLDAVLEGSKQAVLDMKAALDDAGVVEQDPALRQAAGQAFYNTSRFTLSDLRARANRQQLTADFQAYLDGFSPNVQDILENFEFRNQIPRLSRADALGTLIEKLTSPDINLRSAPVHHADGSVKHPGLDNHGEAGLTPRDCNLAMEYLRNEGKDYDDNGLCYYYQRDLVKNREIGLPLHCVYITANPRSSLLLACVEYYGVVRRVICLSKEYEKETFSRVYSVNPVSGKEVSDVEIQLDPSVFGVVTTQTTEELVAGLAKALNQVMASGMRLSRCGAIAKICVERMDGYCERRNLVMRKDDRQNLVEEVAQSLMPLIEHYLTPLKFPEGFDTAKQ